MAENETIAAFRCVAERLRNGTGASRTTIRVDCVRLGLEMETVAVESRDSSARALEGQRTPAVREGAAVRWLTKHRRTFVMEDCLDPWDPEVAPEDYVNRALRHPLRDGRRRLPRRGVGWDRLRSLHEGSAARGAAARWPMIESACEDGAGAPRRARRRAVTLDPSVSSNAYWRRRAAQSQWTPRCERSVRRSVKPLRVGLSVALRATPHRARRSRTYLGAVRPHPARSSGGHQLTIPLHNNNHVAEPSKNRDYRIARRRT